MDEEDVVALLGTVLVSLLLLLVTAGVLFGLVKFIKWAWEA